jgi:hypothetical protein
VVHRADLNIVVEDANLPTPSRGQHGADLPVSQLAFDHESVAGVVGAHAAHLDFDRGIQQGCVQQLVKFLYCLRPFHNNRALSSSVSIASLRVECALKICTGSHKASLIEEIHGFSSDKFGM